MLALGSTVLLNVLFVVFSSLSLPDPALVRERVRVAFATDHLGEVDYRPWDSRRGWHQYNDCVVLQMLSNEGQSRLERVLAPLAYVEAQDLGPCGVLRRLHIGAIDAHALEPLRYTRYWHGYNVVAAVGLRFLELGTLRLALSWAVWGAIVVLAVAASWRGRHVKRAGLTFALAAATIWATPYFAPNFTHGAGDALLLLALAGCAALSGRVTNLKLLLPYAAGVGAVIAYFEMLTGQLPVAAPWLAVLVLAAVRDRGEQGEASGPAIPLLVVVAFAVGAAGTVVAKQLLTLMLVEREAGSHFIQQLAFYMSVPDFEPGWPGMIEPFGRLVNKAGVLTYGSDLAGYCLLAATGLAWATAAVGCWRLRSPSCSSDLPLLACAASMPALWALLLPTHTYVHAIFMVRILVVPAALGALALMWPHRARLPLTVRAEANTPAFR